MPAASDRSCNCGAAPETPRLQRSSLAAASNGVGVYHIYGDETTYGEGYNMQQVPKEEQGLFGRMTAASREIYME